MPSPDAVSAVEEDVDVEEEDASFELVRFNFLA